MPRPANSSNVLLRMRPLGFMSMVFLIVMGACGNAGTSSGTPTTASPKPGKPEHLRSLPSSLTGLGRTTTTVFRGTATDDSRPSNPPDEEGAEYRITRVKVDEVIKGDTSLAGSTVEVRQAIHDEIMPALEAGRRYVLFTTPYHNDHEGRVVHGLMGSFAVGEGGALTDLDPLSQLPPDERSITLDKLRVVLAA